jgi:hypothetical protein
MIDGLYAVNSDGNGIVTLALTSEDGRKHFVPLAVGVLNALLAPILSISQEALDGDDKIKEIQPLTLTAMRAMILDDGSAGLEIRLDGMPLRFALQEGSIPRIIAALTELERAVGGSGTAVRH